LQNFPSQKVTEETYILSQLHMSLPGGKLAKGLTSVASPPFWDLPFPSTGDTGPIRLSSWHVGLKMFLRFGARLPNRYTRVQYRFVHSPEPHEQVAINLFQSFGRKQDSEIVLLREDLLKMFSSMGIFPGEHKLSEMVIRTSPP
jgi:hypothetical protein